jgi:hypothetical protein
MNSYIDINKHPELVQIESILNSSQKYLLTGSRYICGVMNTDIDIVLLVWGAQLFCKKLEKRYGATYCSAAKYADSDMIAMRLGKFNFLVTSYSRYYRQMHIATELAKQFKLTDKADRINLFEAVKGNYDKVDL